MMGAIPGCGKRAPGIRQTKRHLAALDAEAPEALAESMLRLHLLFGTKILGGCCGTDHRHIEEIAVRIGEGAPRPS